MRNNYFTKHISKNKIPAVDFHIHTNWTDGKDWVIDMYNQAILYGLKTVLFSEHVRRNSGEWFLEFANEVRSLNLSNCKALVGAETRVEDFYGNLDCNTSIIKECDLLIASVHRFPSKKSSYNDFSSFTPQEALNIEYRLANAILENPNVNILGHAFGMSIRKFQIIPSKKMLKDVIIKAAKKDIAVEINSFYHPDPWLMIEICQDAKAWMTLGSDAHSKEEVGRIVRVLKGEEILESY